MAKLIVMVGLPGSGKSTISEQYYKRQGYVVHSSDAIREELFGEVYDKANNNRVFEVMRERTKKDLNSGYDVVYDATNLSRKARRFILNTFKNKKSYNEIIAHVVLRDYGALYSYNRNRGFPMDVFDRYRRYFTLPVDSEGFDNIQWTLTNPEEVFYKYEDLDLEEEKIVEFFEDSFKGRLRMQDHPFYNLIGGYDQDNPYHSKTLDEHIKAVYFEAKKFRSKEVTMAALLHDIGKPATAFKNKYGHTSFYGHENVSAYLAKMMFKKYGLARQLGVNEDHVITLISYHMRMHKTKTAKAKNKLIKEVGKDLYPYLCELFVSDVAGH